MPPHLAQKILTARHTIEGERKQVTVMFADFKGSLELMGDQDPEDARAVLDPVLDLMMEAVHHYEGTVNQVMDDGIMALFGAPLAHEDHAVRACFAGLRMQESAARYAADLRRRQGLDVQIRVGLNAGEVVVRSIGTDLHMDYSAVGQTTHLAARVAALARPGTVMLPGDALPLVEGYVEVKALGPVPIKGLPDPVPVYELAGAGPVRSRLQAAASRGFTRFVGRADELVRLGDALARAAAGRGQVAAVVGEPGVGKSRLLLEFVRSPRAAGWLVLPASSVSYGKATSYLPVVDLLRGYFHIEGRDSPRSIRSRVTGTLLTLDEGLTDVIPAIEGLLEVLPDDSPFRGLDPPQRRQRTLDGIKRLLVRESQVQPLLVVFEDLHWIDSETQALLDSFVESVPGARVLLLVNYRPEYHHGWSARSYYREIRIDPLPAASARELLAALLGSDPSVAALVPVLIERTEGNPFFLEESVRALVETGALVGPRGAYRLVGPVAALRIPATVQAVLAARMDRLDFEDKHLLQSASVVGKDVPYAVLEAIAGLEHDALRIGLSHLVGAALLYETRLFPELEYTFTHALTHEVAYAGILHERRRELHRQILDVIERLYADRIGEHIEQLANHALRAGVSGKAVTYLRLAGAKAAARSAHREAIGFFRLALEEMPRRAGDGEPAARAAETIDLLFELRTSLVPLGEFTETLQHLQRAAGLAESAGDRRRLGWVSAYLTQTHYTLGDQPAAIAAAERAIDLATQLDDSALRLAALTGLGQAHQSLGRYREACEHLMGAIALLDGHPARERFGMAGIVGVVARGWLVNALTALGEFSAAEASAREALAIAEPPQHPWSLALAHVSLGFVYLRRGGLAEAVPVLERGLGICREFGVRAWLPMLLSSLGMARALSGDPAAGIRDLEEGIAQAEAMRIRSRHALRLGWLAEACLLAGQRERAREAADQALVLARTYGERGYEAWALRILGEIASGGGAADVDTAGEHYEAALGRAEALGMRPLRAHCHLGLGILALRTGGRDRASRHLTEAVALFRAMDMRLWHARADERLRSLD